MSLEKSNCWPQQGTSIGPHGPRAGRPGRPDGGCFAECCTHREGGPRNPNVNPRLSEPEGTLQNRCTDLQVNR